MEKQLDCQKMNSYHVLVCGGRHFNDYELLKQTLDNLGVNIVQIISGHAVGADSLAETYALKHNIPVRTFPAKWHIYGKSAGPIRNKEMIDYLNKFENKMVVGFVSDDTKGTRNTLDLAKKKNIPVKEIYFIS